METVRTDKWLWAVRLFKTRGMAARACESGRVKRDGRPLKPASPLRPGDVLQVPFADGHGTRTVAVIEPIDKRVGAPRAAECCDDRTPPEVTAERIEHLRNRPRRRQGEQGRPTKRRRRDIEGHRGFFQ